MNRRHYMAWLGSALVAAAALGCNADEEPAGLVNAGGDDASSTAGHGGTSGTGGGAGTGGTSAAVDAAPDQSVETDARGDAAADAGSESSSDGGSDAGTKSYALAVGSDYTGAGAVKLVAVDWATKQIAGSMVFPNINDAVPVVSGGRPFMLERSDGKLVILQKDKPWVVTKTLALGSPEAGAYALNPLTVVSAGAKAYVPLFSTNHIAIVDVDNAALTGQIDLSSLVDAADRDGLVDVFDGAYDASTHRAYFLLLGIPQYDQGIEPDRASRCNGVSPTIIAIDTTTDQLVDLNGDAGGKGVALVGRNPTALVSDLARGRLLVVDAGCYESEGGDLFDAGKDAQAGVARTGRGIEAFGLATGVSSWLYTHADATRLAGLVVVDATHAFLSGNDASYTSHWYPWDPSNGATHGAEVLTMPHFAPHSVGGNLIVGLSPSYVDGGALDTFVSFNIATSVATTVVPDLFGDSVYSGDYNGWALLP